MQFENSQPNWYASDPVGANPSKSHSSAASGLDARPSSRSRRDMNYSDHDLYRLSDSHHGAAPQSIPVNKNGRKYSMKQAFDAWFSNSDVILLEVSVAVKHGENYRLAKPQQIYHLDLHRPRPEGTRAAAADFTSASASQTESLEQSNLVVNSLGSDLVLAPLRDVALPQAAPELPVHSDPRGFQPEPPLANSQDLFAKSVSQQPQQPLQPLPQQFLQLKQPSEISWLYLDPAGNEQGPFTGDVMQEWLTDGYLSFDLQIRRQEEKLFKTLRLFCESVLEFMHPFKVPLPPVEAPPPMATVLETPLERDFGSGGILGGGQFSSAAQTPSISTGGAPTQGFGLNLYSQLMQNGGLGAANIRTLSSSHIFDFMGGSEYPLMGQQYLGGPQFAVDSMNPSIGGSFSQLHMPSLLHQQIQQQQQQRQQQQQPQMSRTNSGWGIDTSLQPSMPSTTSVSGQGTLNMGQPLQAGGISPWINRVQPLLRVSSPFVTGSQLAPEYDSAQPDDSVLNDLHKSVMSGILQDDIANPLPSKTIATFPNDTTETQPVSHHVPVPEPAAPAAQPAPIPAPVAVPASVPDPQPEVNALPVIEPAPASFTKPLVESSVPEPEVETAAPKEKARTVFKTEIAQPETPSQPVIAPWATPQAPKQVVPTLTLKQIQELEAERLEKEKKAKADIKQEIALATALAASKLEEKATEQANSFNWAGSALAVPAKKTLAEIQKEEEAEALRARSAKTLASISATPKLSLASTLASATPKDEKTTAWTTVALKKPLVKKASQTTVPMSYSVASGAINPQVLRTASSSSLIAQSVNANLIKEDFLVWARSAMTNLYPSVSKDDLLEIFTTLPLHSDLAQLISETIYSSSATMDGRRFAQEFMKKRQTVEKQIGDSGLSWSTAIASSANKIPVVDDDGWSVSHKSKKKGRKN